MARDGLYTRKKTRKHRGMRIVLFVLFLFLALGAALITLDRDAANSELPMDTQMSVQTQPVPNTDVMEENTEPQFQSSMPTEQTLPVETETILQEVTMPPETEVVETTPVATVLPPDSGSTQNTVSHDTIDNYAPVLQQYREAIMMDPLEFNRLYGVETELDLQLNIDALYSLAANGETSTIAQILEQPTFSQRFPYVDGATLKFFHDAKQDGYSQYCDPDVYHYAYYNIDGSSSDELLIGKKNDYRDDYSILAIYTFSSYDGPRLLRFVRDDNRWHLSIYTDGTFCMDGSGGASIHYWNYYRMHDEFDCDEPIDSFTVNYDTPRSDYMAAAVEGYEAMLTPVADIMWHPLFQES